MMTATLEPPDRPDSAAAAGYRYQHGDRPLDGYTIQRGAGRGGFGEVYYAISDSGREVALKVVHTYEQIELRGIGQCMNLKSPHLVTIFDVKYGNDGRPWVIMEYVAGPSLRELLDAAPSGLGPQKAAFFLREIGKGLTELHDCGIVHRDLKPANIFFENGYVKIGDYGLSKLISSSQHSGQTVTVGTVHYMAPEIGVGRYDKGIDIYALGALLYEMLTGQVPYLGSSPAEVLMKHLNGNIDTSGIEEPFASVIRKAMAKDPAERYATVQEMVEAVFGTEHVRNSVSQFSPDSLTMVAGRAAREAGPGSAGSFTPSDAPTAQWRPRRRVFRLLHIDPAFVRSKEPWMRARARRTPPPLPGDLFQPPALDTMSLASRIALGAIVAATASIAAGAIDDRGPAAFFFVFFSIAGATTALVLAWRLLAPGLRHESPWLMRLILGGMAGVACLLLGIPFWEAGGHTVAAAVGVALPMGASSSHYHSNTPMAVLLAFLILDWPARLTAIRRERISTGHLITAALAGFLLSHMFEGNAVLAIACLAGTSTAASLVAGWNPTSLRPMPSRPATPPPGPGGAPGMPPPPRPPAPPGASSEGAPSSAPAIPLQRVHKVPKFVRVLWLVLFIAAATCAIPLLAASAGMAGAIDSKAGCFALGAGCSMLAFLAYRRSRTTEFGSWWRYLFLPLLQFACAQTIVVFASMMASQSMGPGEAANALFAIAFPAVMLFVLTLYSRRGDHMTSAQFAAAMPLNRPGSTTFSLAGLGFGLIRLGSLIAGLAVLAASLLLTVLVVGHVPAIVAALRPQMMQELTVKSGTPQWPDLVDHVGMIVDFALALLATGLLLLPRRRAGAVHMGRGLVAIALLFAAAVTFARAIPEWPAFVVVNDGSATFERLFESLRLNRVLISAGLLVLGAFVFSLPSTGRRKAIA